MITVIFAFIFSNALALEVPSQALNASIRGLDNGPSTYKDLYCAHYPWHRAYLCEWTNRQTKQTYRLLHNDARALMESLSTNSATIKCSNSPWAEVCDMYFYRADCELETCTLKAL